MTPAGYSENHAHIPALIMGNGPSLARVDFSALNGMATFGMNAAYRYWVEVDWWPDYYSCLDLVVGDSHGREIASLVDRAEELGIRRFLLRLALIRSRGALRRSPLVTCYEELLADGVLPKLRDVTTGAHTLLWANRLGYSTLLLAGVDCDYTEVVGGATDLGTHLEISEPAPNPNYFFDGYQQPGDRFNRPNVTSNMHVRSWTNAARHLQPEAHVVNLNSDSCVHIFIKNRNEREPLAPGVLMQSSECALDDDMTDADLADLRNTLRRCNRYRGAASLEAIRSYLSHVIHPSRASEVTRWRPSGTSLITVSDATNQPLRGSSPYITVIVRGIGNLVESSDSSHHQDMHKSPCVAIHLAAPVGLRALAALIQSLQDALGTPPIGIQLLDFIRSWSKLWRRFIPTRIRAVDYAHLLNRLRSRRSPH
jgi:hypothetical protein